jgi:hypothetical protein
MEEPEDPELPFFTYGIFKPGQISHFRLKEYVDHSELATIDRALCERDGIPLLDTFNSGQTKGELFWFTSEHVDDAYDEITEIEPENQYEWTHRPVETESGEYDANLLAGISPYDGGYKLEDWRGRPIQDWDGRKNDPMFNEALEIIEETIEKHGKPQDNYFKSFFQLQMAYLLLWTVIERYATLRYGFGRGSYGEREALASEEAFAIGLEEVAKNRDGVELHRTHAPEKTNYLNTDTPEEAIQYYYQVRNNIAHRGKSLDQDLRILEDSLQELYTIFSEYVLLAAFDE